MEKCKVCDLSYTSKQGLEEHNVSLMHHIKLQHQTGKEEHTCDLCSISFPSLSLYSKHINDNVHRAALKACKQLKDINVDEVQQNRQKEKDMGKSKSQKKTDAKNVHGKNEKGQAQDKQNTKNKSKKKKAKEFRNTKDCAQEQSMSNMHDSLAHESSGPSYRQSRWDEFSGDWYNDFQENFSQNTDGDGPCFSLDFTRDQNFDQHPAYRNFNDNDFLGSYHRAGFPGHGNRDNFFHSNRNMGNMGWGPQMNSNKSFQQMGPRHPGNFDMEERGSTGDMFFRGKSKPVRNPNEGRNMAGPHGKKKGSSPRGRPVSSSLDRMPRERSESAGSSASGKAGSKKRSSSSVTKKPDSAPLSAAEDHPQGSKTLSLKAGRIIDNILKGKAPKGLLGAYPQETNKDEEDGESESPRLVEKPPKAPKQQHQPSREPKKVDQVKQFQAPRGKAASCKDNPNRGAYLLDRAENLCREIREKRELAKKGKGPKYGLGDEELRISLTSLSQQSLSSSLTTLHDKSATTSTESFAFKDTLSSPITLMTAGSGQVRHSVSDMGSASNIQTALKESESSVKRVAVPNLPARTRHSSESSNKEKKSGDKLDKERILKLVNSPRSRKERLQVGKILRTFTKQQKQRPKLSLVNSLERPEESETEVNLDELPEDIKLQINMLIEEELDSLDPQEKTCKGLTVASVQTSLGIEPSLLSPDTSRNTPRKSSGKSVIDLLDDDNNDAVEITSVKLSSAAGKKKGVEESNQTKEINDDLGIDELCGSMDNITRCSDMPLTLNDLVGGSEGSSVVSRSSGNVPTDSVAVTSSSNIEKSVEAYMSSDRLISLTASMLDTTNTVSSEPNVSTTLRNNDEVMSNVDINSPQNSQVDSEVTDYNPAVPLPLFQNYMDVDTQNVERLPEQNEQIRESTFADDPSVNSSVIIQPLNVTNGEYSMLEVQSESVPVLENQFLLNTSFTDSLQKNEYGQFVIAPESLDDIRQIDNGRQVDATQQLDNTGQVGDLRQMDTITPASAFRNTDNMRQLDREADTVRHSDNRRLEEAENSRGDLIEEGSSSSGDRNNLAHKRRRSERSPAVLIPASGCDSNSSGNKVDVKRFRADSEAEPHSTATIQEGNTSVHQESYPVGEVDCVGVLYELSIKEEQVRRQLGTVDVELRHLQDLLMKTQQKLKEAQQKKETLLSEESQLRNQRLDLLKGAVNNRAFLAKTSSLNSLSCDNNRHTSTPNISSISLNTIDTYNIHSDCNDKATPSRVISFDGSIEDPHASNSSLSTYDHPPVECSISNKEVSLGIVPLTISPDNIPLHEASATRNETVTRDVTPSPSPSRNSDTMVNSTNTGENIGQDMVEESPGDLNVKVSDGASIEEADSTVELARSKDHEMCAADSSSQLGETKQSSESLDDHALINNNNSLLSADDGAAAPEMLDKNNADGCTNATTISESGSVDNNDILPSNCTADGATVQYVGSFSVPGNNSALLHKLAENFAELKQKPFMFLEPTQTATENPSPAESTRRVSREESSANTSVDTVVVNPLHSTTAENVQQNSNQECEGDGETEIVTDTCHKSRIRSPKRRKKTKAAARGTPQESISTSEGEDVNSSQTTTTTASSSPSRRGRRKKFSNPLEVQLVKEYLHAESSTDVEINGLEPKPKPVKQKASSSKTGSENEDTLELAVHELAVTCMCVWGNTLVTGSEDCTIRRTTIDYHNPSENKTDVMVQWDRKVQCVHVSNASGKVRIYAAWEDSCLCVYDYKKKNRWITQTKSFGENLLCSHERWGTLFVGMSKGSILCFDIKANKQDELLSVSDKAITQICTVEEKKRELLVVASSDCSVTVRDRQNGSLVYSIEGHTKSPLALYIDNDLVYSGGMDRCLQVHTWKTGEVANVLQLGTVIRNIHVTGEHLYVVLQNGLISCYHLKTLTLKYTSFGSKSTLIHCSAVDKPTAIFCGLKSGCVRQLKINKREVWPCQFGRCDNLLGSKADLEHHLLQDHVLPHNKIMCLWKDCPNVYLHSNKPKKVKEHLRSHLVEPKISPSTRVKDEEEPVVLAL